MRANARRRAGSWLAAALAFMVGSPAMGATEPPRAAATVAVGFEDAAIGSAPDPSRMRGIGADSRWRATVVDDLAANGARSLRIEGGGPAETSNATPTWVVDATAFRGAVVRVECRAHAATGPVVGVAVDRPGSANGFHGTLVAGEPDTRGWRTFVVEAGIAEDATELLISIQPATASEPVHVDDLAIAFVVPLAERPYELRFAPASECSKQIATPFAMRSRLLSAFAGREVVMHAAVVAPGAGKVGEMPICYVIHGFGGNHLAAWRQGRNLLSDMLERPERGCVHVFLDASCENGHHCFADSANNGPWGQALTAEFMPAIERAFGGERPSRMRFVRGHSSGGWSALWLQVTYPETFGGCWATAPDPVDFRDFSGIDLYRDENAYVDGGGKARALIVRGDEVAQTVEGYVRGEMKTAPRDGQIASFDAVFSPRGADGRPKPMFDRASGAIDRAVVESWKRYDIGLTLRSRWKEIGPKLAGKLHVWCGEDDTFRLDGAVRLLRKDLAAIGSDADVLLVPERDHGTLFHPHPSYWPRGMLERIGSEIASKTDQAKRGLTPRR